MGRKSRIMIKRINVLKDIGCFSALNPTQGTEGDSGIHNGVNAVIPATNIGKSPNRPFEIAHQFCKGPLPVHGEKFRSI